MTDKVTLLEIAKCGKWMHFFKDFKFALEICQKAIDEKICYECKCTDMENLQTNTGVICFYLNGDDLENHKRVIQFMMDNKLIPKTIKGKYYNISFKYDTQTRAAEYDAGFEAKLRLDQFINLKTGKFIV